jgi:hypothetical protein
MLSIEEIEAKKMDLEKQHGVEVHPIVFLVEGAEKEDQVVGFIKEPPFLVKLRVMDKALISPISSAAELLEISLIKEASDSRIYDESPKNDKIRLGAVMAAYGLIKYQVDVYKKK